MVGFFFQRESERKHHKRVWWY